MLTITEILTVLVDATSFTLTTATFTRLMYTYSEVLSDIWTLNTWNLIWITTCIFQRFRLFLAPSSGEWFTRRNKNLLTMLWFMFPYTDRPFKSEAFTWQRKVIHTTKINYNNMTELCDPELVLSSIDILFLIKPLRVCPRYNVSICKRNLTWEQFTCNDLLNVLVLFYIGSVWMITWLDCTGGLTPP